MESEISYIEEKITCPNCSQQIPKGTKFCPECGVGLLPSNEETKESSNTGNSGEDIKKEPADRFLIGILIGIGTLIIVVVIFIRLFGFSVSVGGTQGPADRLLSNQWGSDSQTLGVEMLTATGHQDYIGSSDFPGQTDVTDAPHGAHTVTFTIEAAPGGTLWDSGTVEFDFWLSQDGNQIRRENINASMLQ